MPLSGAQLASSAPHVRAPGSYAGPLKDWGYQPGKLSGEAKSDGLLLHKSADGLVESGIWQCSPGEWPLELPRDELCYFIRGSGVYESEGGQFVEIRPERLVFFPAGWRGKCSVTATLRNTYMLNNFASAGQAEALVLDSPAGLEGPFKDWGSVPTMLEGVSNTSGRLLYKGPSGQSESGVWICTPGLWNCHVTRDEFCHFLRGSCTYTHESGEVIEIIPDTVAFFPKDWRGTCRVHETVRKIYMIS